MIDRLFKLLRPFIRWVIKKPTPVLLTSIALAIIGFLLARQLTIDTDLSKLIPDSYHSVQALNKLTEQVGGEHDATVAIQSPSFEANRAFAEVLIPKVLGLKKAEYQEPYFKRVEYRREIKFLKHNALYFATSTELDLLQEYLEAEIEDAKNKANPFYFDLDDEEGLRADSLANELIVKYDQLAGSEYNTSPDSTVLVIKFFPSHAQTELEFIRHAYSDLNTLISTLNPCSYHPEMIVVAGGPMIRTLIEIETIVADIKSSFGAGVFMLMLAVVSFFFYKSYRARAGRQFNFSVLFSQLLQVPAHTLIMGLPLVLSLCWTFGLAYLFYAHLNIMTSTLGLLLFGMGIDFGIHFFARYTEERGKGESVSEAIETTFMTTGQAIFAVGITTAAAFFILMVADFKGFSEFGAISGIGLILAIVSYTIFLPALLVVFERSPLLNLHTDISIQLESDNRFSKNSDKKNRWKLISTGVIGLSIVITLMSVTEIPKLSFEYDFGELEPKYERYSELNRIASKASRGRSDRNSAYIIVENPSEAPQVADILRKRKEMDFSSPTIKEIEILQDRYPFDDEEANLKIDRLVNITELLDDPFLRSSTNRDILRLRESASTKHIIPVDSVPDFIKAPFTSISGSIGNLVIIHPSVSLSDGRNSMNFADDVSSVTLPDGTTYYAGSTSIVASDMLRLLMEEAPLMVALTIAFIIIFKLLILRNIKWVALALLPLITSFVWLFGLMVLFGWKLNFYNLVVFPTILGIGDDSGIHIVHRYLEEGKGAVSKVLRSTGEHISISIFTTMLGFSGLLFSIHPGLRTIGELAVLGIGLSLIAALILLPSIIFMLEYFSKKRTCPPTNSIWKILT
ncbi:MAG: MMPL family transporter [Gracilimonas sp.]|uniref:efflux RND transporter permease subunit n=1 Tax=Gracilimonas sp. TaxID=1974203 RepID=UPI0019BE8037|nr:MMPL family transporter [Gracilimonas sp.]MBD3616294.1 MMPL family transporter [Gracilimonas sp.]